MEWSFFPMSNVCITIPSTVARQIQQTERGQNVDSDLSCLPNKNKLLRHCFCKEAPRDVPILTFLSPSPFIARCWARNNYILVHVKQAVLQRGTTFLAYFFSGRNGLTYNTHLSENQRANWHWVRFFFSFNDWFFFLLVRDLTLKKDNFQ